MAGFSTGEETTVVNLAAAGGKRKEGAAKPQTAARAGRRRYNLWQRRRSRPALREASRMIGPLNAAFLDAPELSSALLVLVLLLAGATAWLAVRVRALALADVERQRQFVELRSVRTFDEELREAVRRKTAERLEALGPDELSALEDAIRARLPQVIAAVLANPSPELASALSARITSRALERLGTALAGSDSAIDSAVQDRFQALLADPNADAWEPIDRKLAARALAASNSPAAEVSRQLEQRIHEGLLERAQDMFAEPEQHAELFERLDEKLIERIVRVAESPGPDCARALVGQVEHELLARTAAMFESPEEHGDLVEALNEKLAQRLVAVAENLPPETAARIDGRICEQLAEQADRLFDVPEEHEDLFSLIDEKLGGRIVRLAADLPPETATRIDSRIAEQLLAEVNHLFEAPEEYEDLFERIDEKLGARAVTLAQGPPEALAQRLDGRISDGLADALDEMFRHPDEHEEVFEKAREQLGRRILRLAEHTSKPDEARDGRGEKG
jgi:hypothetical protein